MSNAAEAISRYVAEGALVMMISLLKDLTGYNYQMKVERVWPTEVIYNDSLFDKKVGLIGLGKVGRHLLRLLKPFNVEISLFDPYISEADCKALGVLKADLDTLLKNSGCHIHTLGLQGLKYRSSLNHQETLEVSE